MVDKSYYVSTGNSEVLGPFAGLDLPEKVVSGEIPKSAVVCEVGLQDWQPIRNVLPDWVLDGDAPQLAASQSRAVDNMRAGYYAKLGADLANATKKMSPGVLLFRALLVLVIGAIVASVLLADPDREIKAFVRNNVADKNVEFIRLTDVIQLSESRQARGVIVRGLNPMGGPHISKIVVISYNGKPVQLMHALSFALKYSEELNGSPKVKDALDVE